MSLWETIDELLDDSTANNATQLPNDNGNKEQSLSDNLYDDNDLDQNEILGLEYEEDDLGLLDNQMDASENKDEKEPEELDKEPIKEESSKELEINRSPKSFKQDEKKTSEKTKEFVKSPGKQPRHKNFKPRAPIAKSFPKNDGILPLPTHFIQPSNVPVPRFNMPNFMFPRMAQFSSPQFNFNEIYGPHMAPYQPNPYQTYDQAFMYANFPYPNQTPVNSYQNDSRAPGNQFIRPQYIQPKANCFPRNSTYMNEAKCESKTQKSNSKEDMVKKPKSSRSRKELDLLLEKRLAELEKERTEEEKLEQIGAKRKLENEEKKPEAKSESESMILAQDPDYINKMEEQKRKREEILRLKEEKRNQRIKQMGKKNENIPEDKPKIQNSSTNDNRIIKTSSKRIIALNTTDKKILDMSNSLGVRAKVNDYLLVIA